MAVKVINNSEPLPVQTDVPVEEEIEDYYFLVSPDSFLGRILELLFEMKLRFYKSRWHTFYILEVRYTSDGVYKEWVYQKCWLDNGGGLNNVNYSGIPLRRPTLLRVRRPRQR